MNGDGRPSGADYEEPRVPAALRERVDDLYRAYRGYEPASFQESLGLVVDLAAASLDPDGASPVGRASVSAGARASDDADGEQSQSATADAVADDSSVDEFVDDLDDPGDAPSPAVESLIETRHVDGVVHELAAEVIDEMTDDAFEELEHGVDQGVGAGVTDGMGATDAAGEPTAPSGNDGDGVPESLTADPESACARCGRDYRVSVLRTTILEDDGSVALVCPSCTE